LGTGRKRNGSFPIGAAAIYIAVVGLIFCWSYWKTKETSFAHIDERLRIGAGSIPFLLPENFHDLAVSASAISPESDWENIHSLTRLANTAGFKFLFTLVKLDGQIHITASSASRDELESGNQVHYFERYDEAHPKLRDAFKQKRPTYLTYTDRWGTFRAAALPRRSPGGRTYLAVAELEISYVHDKLRFQLFWTFLEALLLLAASLPVFLVYFRRERAYAQQLERANRRLKEEEQGRIEIEKQLAQSQKMEAIGTLAGGIAHDFNNILASVMGYTELALEDVEKGSSVERFLREIQIGGNRAKDLVRQILTFARRQGNEPAEAIQVAPVAKEVLKLIRSSLPSTIEIRSDISSEAFVLGAPIAIHQILLNLCTNAGSAMEADGGVLTVSLRDVFLDDQTDGSPVPGPYLELCVSDTGVGIPPDVLDAIFEPYFTTKGPGEGTGMGLAVVHGILKSLGGGISVKSQPGKGTRFTVLLPAASEDKFCEAEGFPEGNVWPTGTERILFVDDDSAIGKLGRETLERLGYSVTARSDGAEALDWFRSRANEFDLIITDMTMPKMRGDQLVEFVREIRPNLPVVACTGFSRHLSEERIREMRIDAVLYKPISLPELAQTVRRVLDGWPD
jgi:signal transduction histidine kinase